MWLQCRISVFFCLRGGAGPYNEDEDSQIWGSVFAPLEFYMLMSPDAEDHHCKATGLALESSRNLEPQVQVAWGLPKSSCMYSPPIERILNVF